jgi:hypothetical protein
MQSFTADNLVLKHNLAYDKGGALFIQNYNKLSLLIFFVKYSGFLDNHSVKEGGVAYNHGILVKGSEILFQKCEFLRNQGLRGAVIYNAVLNFASVYERCKFNYRYKYAFSDVDGGSVFYNDDNHDLILRESFISHNSVKKRGGVAQILKGKLFDWGSVFQNNTAGYMGGVFILQRVSEAYLNGSLFFNSTKYIIFKLLKKKKYKEISNASAFIYLQ